MANTTDGGTWKKVTIWLSTGCKWKWNGYKFFFLGYNLFADSIWVVFCVWVKTECFMEIAARNLQTKMVSQKLH